MALPLLQHSSAPALDLAADVLVVGVRKGKEGPELLGGLPGLAELAGSLAGLAVTGAEDEVRRLANPYGAATTLALVGLGSEVTANSLRHAAGAAARQLGGARHLAFALPVASDEELQAVAEGAALGAYAFTAYRSTPPEATKTPPAEITIVAAEAPGGDALERAAAIAGAVHTIRDLVNTPPVDLYPETFAARVVELAEGLPVTVTVLDEEALHDGGYGGILGVGAGSTRGPRLVKVEYAPDAATKHLALVGKGITFDSGGLSLKPASSMVGMKYDMTGAATVLAATLALSRLGTPTRVTAWLCLAENMPSGSAIRPNDVLRIRGGKTVEVLNTDAEGRLVLADGLVAASEERPDAIVDVATLTGAARIALGDRYVGLMGAEALVQQLVEVSKEVGELLWPMPLPGELRSALNSDVADIANARIGNSAGGMLLGGVFLQEFIGDDAEGERLPWAHLDIAGPANNEGATFGFTGKGPSGVTARTLIRLGEALASA